MLLKPPSGQLVGELALLLDRRRTADVVAGPNGATVIVSSRSAIPRLVKSRDQATLWRNMARVLAERLAAP
ncbi:MAG: hypothetical protein AAF602_19950 [Myxococcota bacterium]